MSEDKKIVTESLDSFPITKPQILIRNKGIEMIFEEGIAYWMDNFPEEVKIFVDHDMKREKQNLIHDKAISKDGHFMLKGLIPPRMKKAIGNMLIKQEVMTTDEAKNWEKNIELINKFFSIFKIGCVNETSDLR